jgi:hypothetical protein
MDGLLGFLTPDQQKMAQQQALTQGLLGLGSALLQGSTGAPGQPRPRLGQVLGQALPVGMQGYQGGIDQALQQILTGQKMQDMQRQRQQQQQEAQRQEAQRQALESYISSLPMEEQNRFRAFPTQAAEAMFREPKGAYRPLSTEEVQKMTGYTPREGETFQLSPQGKVEPIVRPVTPPATVNVQLGTERKYGETLGAEAAQQDMKLLEQARSVPSQLETIQESRALLDQGNVFTGKFANQKLFIAAAGQSLGVTGKDTNEIVANTQRLFANRAKATLDNVKASGLGSGQGFTDKDRDFLEKTVLGNIEFSADSLKRQLDIEERAARGIARKWNDRFKQIPKTAIEGTGIGPVNITAPPAATPGQPSQRVRRYNPATQKVE